MRPEGNYCTSGVTAPSSATPSIAARPASTHRRRKGLLAQRLRDARRHRLERRLPAGFARQHFDHVQAKATVHEVRQHADRGIAEDFARELGRAVGGGQPAEGAALRSAGAVRQLARGDGEAVGAIDRLVAAARAQVDQAGLGSLPQRGHVDARRHREQHVAKENALTHGEACRVGGIVAAAGVLGGLGHGDLAVEQRLDRAGGGLADGAAFGRRVVPGQQAGPHRSLAQQLGAGALPQFFVRQGLLGVVQRHPVDGCHRDRRTMVERAHLGTFVLRTPVFALGAARRAHEALRGTFWPAGTLSLRERTSW